MKEALQPFQKRLKVIYGCVVAHFVMNTRDLAELVPLCAGFDSIENKVDEPLRTALRNLRLSNSHPKTIRSLKKDVEEYIASSFKALDRTESSHPFNINKDLSFTPAWEDSVPESVLQALEMLQSPLDIRRVEDSALADPAVESYVDSGGDSRKRFRIDPLGFSPLPRPVFPTDRRSVGVGKVKYAELLAQADKFDAIDEASGVQAPGTSSWRRRLTNAAGELAAKILKNTPSGAVETDTLDLSDVKHMIGLPGAGKSTLLYLLAGWAQANEKKVFFAFPSIAVATNFVDILSAYKVDVGLLYGQSKTARSRHVANYAAALGQKDNGLAQTRPSAKYFATNCSLAGFSSDEDEHFPHDKPPCESVIQIVPGKSGPVERTKICALSSECGRLSGDRSLGKSSIWAGHIMSLNRRVPRIFSNEKIAFFEYVSRYFDLVVVDECDMAQSLLDSNGTPAHVLYGEEGSVSNRLITDVHQKASSGRNSFVGQDRLPEALSATAGFNRSSDRLAAMILHSKEEFKEKNANQLHTSQTLLSDIFCPEHAMEEDEQATYKERLSGLESLWDLAIKIQVFDSPFFQPELGEDEEAGQLQDLTDDELTPDILRAVELAAESMGVSVERAEDLYKKFVRVFGRWLKNGARSDASALYAVMRSAEGLPMSRSDAEQIQLCGLLLCVSEILMHHFLLDPHLRYLHSIDLLSDDLSMEGKGTDEELFVPSSLAGALSGVRYTLQAREEGVSGSDISLYLVDFRSVPRLLPYRMNRSSKNEKGSLSVLFTSATSLLGQSPSFHNTKEPDYILARPNAGKGWQESRYEFLPLDGEFGSKLRFSGAPLRYKQTNLNKMAKELLGENPKYSRVTEALASNGFENGISRKCAFIVNSYQQCEELYEFISRSLPAWRDRLRFLTRGDTYQTKKRNSITTPEIEKLSDDNQWDVVIFPMSAIGRGVNIVFPSGPRQGQAKIGSLFFLTRPHPRGDSLQLVQGLVARRSQDFDELQFDNKPQAINALREHRQATIKEVKSLLRIPLVASRLGPFRKAFVADQMIMILQTIGRAMRGDQPAYVYFVDAAWAPKTANGEADNKSSSMLVGMQEILEECLSSPNNFVRECYENLYRPFMKPLSEMNETLTSEKVYEQQ